MQSGNSPDNAGVIDGLIDGFRAFRTRYYEQQPQRMRELSERGQSPEVLVIACSDSRVDPALLLNAEPGDLFTVRNVANLVPPYHPDTNHHSTSAALEFAVRDLEVRHIVILGHSSCGGIAALRQSAAGTPIERDFIAPWMEIAADACRCAAGESVPDQQAVEHDGIRISLKNLRSFPWVDAQILAGKLTLHGWWVDLAGGRLCAISPDGDAIDLVAAPAEAAGVAD
jgi:carbonic anhydrase